MRKATIGAALVTVPLVVGGLVYANSARDTSAERPPRAAREVGYTCPVTGEELPCPNCCPLSQSK